MILFIFMANNWSKEVFPKWSNFSCRLQSLGNLDFDVKRMGRRQHYINILCIRPISCAEEGGESRVKRRGTQGHERITVGNSHSISITKYYRSKFIV